MKKKLANYALLTIFSLSLLLDVFFMLRAYYDLRETTLVEGVTNEITVEKYRTTTKIPKLEITTAENTKQNTYAKFGSISIRWLLQDIPRPGDRVTFHTIKNSKFFEENYAFGMAVNERCSPFKLWFDIFAAYLHSTLFIVSWIVVFISVLSLYGYADVETLNRTMAYFLILYPILKISVWTFIY